MSMDDATVAARAIAALDLTNLNDDCSAADIDALCARAAAHRTAAVCVWPRFVVQSLERLNALGAREGGLRFARGVRVATVVNFPHGADDPHAAARETAAAIADGADEIDVVVPYRASPDRTFALTEAVAAECGGAVLKTILETGEVKDPGLIRALAEAALDGGADFLKTSTGKVPVNATPEAMGIFYEAILASGDRSSGVKAAGGVRTLADARAYLEAADAAMGEGWATPDRFRFGASGLLDALLGVGPAKGY